MSFMTAAIQGGKRLILKGYGYVYRGFSYVGRKGKSAIINHTDIGERLKNGILHAQKAVKQVPTRLQKASDNITKRYRQVFERDGLRVVSNLCDDPEFVATCNKYMSKLGVKINFFDEVTGLPKSDAKIIQNFIEASGVGPTKLAQIKSNDAGFMERLYRRSSDLAKAIERTKSNCSFSRTVEEAQKVIEESFPGQGIKIVKEMSAGSIGAAYIVEKPDGTRAVVKMLKKGVTREQLDLEETLLQKIIPQLEETPEGVAQIKKMMKNVYDGYRGELNFAQELKNNRILAQGAQRYKVAAITDISKDGTCIVMDMAEGIQMNKLLEILQDYKANPLEFATKYAEQIKKYPWLGEPERVIKELPVTLTRTFDEQFMFMKKGGASLMHGDPHTGNFFITTDEKGRLIPEFIDTGNCVQRTGAQIQQDISFFSNYVVGNSDGIAKYFVDQCAYNGADKAELTQRIAKDIQEIIFAPAHDITKFGDVQGNIQAIMESHGLRMSVENATALKAQMQFFHVISEANQLADKSTNMMAIIMKDIPQASWSMLKAKTNPFSALKEAFKFAYHHQQQAVGTAYQFSLKDVERRLNLKA